MKVGDKVEISRSAYTVGLAGQRGIIEETTSHGIAYVRVGKVRHAVAFRWLAKIEPQELAALREEMQHARERAGRPLSKETGLSRALHATFKRFPFPPAVRDQRSVRIAFLSYATSREILSSCADSDAMQDVPEGQRAVRSLTVGETRALVDFLSGRSLGAEDWDLKTQIDAWSDRLAELKAWVAVRFGGQQELPMVAPESTETECWCCGAEGNWLPQRIGGGLFADLCPGCEGTKLEGPDVRCPAHGDRGAAEMAYFFSALAKYNARWKTKKRGPRVRRGIDWEAETQKLREAWRKNVEKKGVTV